MMPKRKTPKQYDRSAYLFILPYVIMFVVFIALPVIIALLLSVTYFNMVQNPQMNWLDNFIFLFTNDEEFMQFVLPNTIKFAILTGPGGYILGFFLAWMLAQVPRRLRTILALIIYSPSMTAGVAMAVVWKILFAGDQNGYLNSLLLRLGFIVQPIQWLQSPDHLLNIMIIVTLWSSMGVGFLAMLAGIMNIDQTLYEAAYIDGLRNRFQEIFFITIPSMRPQMLFGAVMAIVNSFNAGGIGVALSGANPTPQYSGQLIVNHIEDYGFIRYEMGYASAISVVLLLLVYLLSKTSFNLFGDKD